MTPPENIERVLLLDDNEADNVYHEIVIRAAGFEGELVVHESGASALAHLEQLAAAGQSPPNLILLDINMPGMSGFEFARAVQPLLRAHPAVIIVMLSSSSASGDRDNAEQMTEISGFLTKPLTVEATRELLARPAPGPIASNSPS